MVKKAEHYVMEKKVDKFFDAEKKTHTSEKRFPKMVWVISDDVPNSLAVSALLKEKGFVADCVSSEKLKYRISEMCHCLVIYDVMHSASFVDESHYLRYYQKIVEVPRSAIIVGLGNFYYIPSICEELCIRTATFIGKPFNINEVIDVSRVFFNKTICYIPEGSMACRATNRAMREFDGVDAPSRRHRNVPSW